MKYATLIQTEFLKFARPWAEMPLTTQFEYLQKHPRSRFRPMFVPKTEYEKHGETIANSMGLYYNGPQEGSDFYVFTDPETETTFLARDLEETIKKLEDRREAFRQSDRLALINKEFMKLAICLHKSRK